MLGVALGAGHRLPAGDDGRLAVRRPLPAPPAELPPQYLVCHPGTSAPARAYPADRWCTAITELGIAGWPVALTGGPAEQQLTAGIAAAAHSPEPVIDLAGRLELDELAGVLEGAAAVVVGNTGPAHLAAAVGTPVVSLFAPVVPSLRWAPYGVPIVLLGDQHATCRGSRRQVCPVPGHPCLTSVTAAQITRAVQRLTTDVQRVGGTDPAAVTA
jgi:ADP-heptose:LPS heptosyltransferase